MGWFQRYGIPGAFLWGSIALWLFVFFSKEMNSLDGTSAQALAAIAAITFLPIGYIISITQQFLYLVLPKKYVGITGRAIERAGFFESNTMWQWQLEAEACLLVMSKKIKAGNESTKDENNKLDLETENFITGWIKNRNDVMAINLSLLLAMVLAPLVAWLVPAVLADWSLEWKTGRLIFVIVIFFFVFAISFLDWFFLSKQEVRVEAGSYKMLRGEIASELTFKREKGFRFHNL